MSFQQCDDGKMTVEVWGPDHCGPNQTSPKVFRWAVQSEWPDGALDKDGFLLDNLEYQQFFRCVERTRLSCELLAEFCAFRLIDMASGRANWIEVTIWPVPDGNVNVTARVTRDQWATQTKRVWALE